MTRAVNLATVGSNANSGGTLITSGTAVASTSGTAINFTGIPSWVKRITVMFSGVSTSGTSNYLVQVGSGSVTTTGYSGSGTIFSTSSLLTGTSTAGFLMRQDSAAGNISGAVVLSVISGNTLVASGTLSSPANTYSLITSGTITLGGAIDRVRVTTVNGTDTFDAGTINILYE
jgi:hypothetical protein